VCFFFVEFVLRMWSCTAIQPFKSYGSVLGRLRFLIRIRTWIDLIPIVAISFMLAGM